MGRERADDAGRADDNAVKTEWEEYVAPVQAAEEIRSAVAELDKAQRRVTDAVRAARASGASWTVIGRAAGISRQSAHERWAKIAD